MNASKADTPMLIIDPSAGDHHDGRVGDLAELLEPGSVLVVNDAATFPARIWGRLPDGAVIEVRLIDAPLETISRAVLFGSGSYRDRTEDRAAPPLLTAGTLIDFGGVMARIVAVSKLSPRLLWLRFTSESARVWHTLYALGRPIQYSYEAEPFPLYSVQTAFGVRPWSAEMPSAARPLDWSLVFALRAKGIESVALTHAAGLSATGDAALDAALPLPERYEIPERTADVVNRAKREGRRVLAVGTTVVRALESAVDETGSVRAGAGVAQRIVTPETALRCVDGLLSGIHVPGESHYRLLGAFTDADTLERASEHARARGYRLHERGDACLIWSRQHQRAVRGIPAAAANA